MSMIEILYWMIIGGILVKIGDWIWEYVRDCHRTECEHEFEEVGTHEVDAVYRRCNKCGSVMVSISVPSDDFKKGRVHHKTSYKVLYSDTLYLQS